MIVRTLIVLSLGFAAPALAQSGASRATPARPSATRLANVMAPSTAVPADIEARRAAAARLLVASRFRERQAVTIQEGLHTAELEMAGDCLQRAIDGRNMQTCRAIANPSDALRARLAASQSAILDEVIAASQSVYARRFTVAEMDEITRFFDTPVGRRYGEFYPQIIADVQQRKRVILRRYLNKAAAEPTDHKAS